MFRYLLGWCFLGSPLIAVAQQQQEEAPGAWHFSAAAMGIGTSNAQVPFWMRTNQYGSLPLDGVSGAVSGTVSKQYKADSISWFNNRLDWAGSAELRLNAGNKVAGILTEASLKAKYRIFQVQAGRTKDLMGLVDSTLSSGAFAVSGNALGIPKAEISVPDYWTLPILKGAVAIRGNFAVGYVGDVLLRSSNTPGFTEAKTWYHQKSLYGRIGKDSWKVKFYGGFNHQVFWGDDRKILGEGYTLNGLQSFWYVVTGKVYTSVDDPGSKVGNHIGSIDQAVSVDFRSLRLRGYHQFFYDVGGLYHLNNIKDGLWGLSLENTAEEKRPVHWNKFLFEFLYSKSQGGELTSKPSPSGDEDYYNNFLHQTGWSYEQENMGNNFLTNKKYQRKELPSYAKEYFGNNRVMLFHIGAEWQLYQWSITNRVSFSRNFGTYATSPIGNTTGLVRIVQPPPYFYPVSQFSGSIEASRPLKNNFRIGFVLAGDYGDLLYNSIGGMVKLTKSW